MLVDAKEWPGGWQTFAFPANCVVNVARKITVEGYTLLGEGGRGDALKHVENISSTPSGEYKKRERERERERE